MRIEHQEVYHPTEGQIKRDISQKLNALYYNWFAHRAEKIDCHLIDNKVIIFGEGIITPIENILLEASSFNLFHQVRQSLDSSIEASIKELIEKIVRVEVVSCRYHTDLKTQTAIGVILLANSPQIRPKKTKRQKNRKNVLQFDRAENQ